MAEVKREAEILEQEEGRERSSISEDGLPPLLRLISARYNSFFSRASSDMQQTTAAHADVEMGSVSHDVNTSSNDEGSSSSEDNEDQERAQMRANPSSSQALKPALVSNPPSIHNPGKKVAFKTGFGPAKLTPFSTETEFTETSYYSQSSSFNLERRSNNNNNYAVFKTKSGRLVRQLTRIQSRRSQSQEESTESQASNNSAHRDHVDFRRLMHRINLPARRYFAALTGPELETVRDSEELLLSDDKLWPLLLRIPIACFGVSLGLGSQTILWKTLATSSSMQFLRIPLTVNLILWYFAVAVLALTFVVYGLKCLLYLEAVKREYYHPVRVNFFFAPWIACMFLTLGLPPSIAQRVDPILWCVFMAPVFLLELKIYGQWLSGGHRRLSRVANPSTHLSVVGNFVGALLAGVAGWKEPAVFFWAVGLAHYLVVFVTLYQRLPTAAVLPKDLHPVFFLFVAAPSAASVAWKSIVDRFDHVSRIAYFVALFLYMSLVVRINFFRGFTFSFSWWAYTFPMTAAAIATIHYSMEVKHPISQGAAVLLSSVSSIVVSILFFLTLFNGFVRCTLFPNDRAIAITAYKKDELDGSTSPAVDQTPRS